MTLSKLPLKILFTTHYGLGVALENEIKKYSFPVIKSGSGFAITECQSLEKVGELLYKIQTATNAILLFNEFEFNDYVDLEEKISSLDFSSVEKWLNERYHVRCVRFGEHEFSSPDVVEIGQRILHEKIKPTGEGFVAETKFVIENQKGFFGIDLAGVDMSKRDYRIFRHAASIKGSLGACLLSISEFKTGVLIDPFCKDATVCIEAAFWTGKSSLRKFSWESLSLTKMKYFLEVDWIKLKQDWDKTLNPDSDIRIIGMDSSNHNLSLARKNIQISGLKDEVELVREDLEWLSTRFDDNSVDLIITTLPSPTKRLVEKIARKIYAEFLEEAIKIISKKGRMVTYIEFPDVFLELAKAHGFSVDSKIQFHMGKQPSFIIILKK